MNTKRVIVGGLVLSIAISGRMLGAQDAQSPVVDTIRTGMATLLRRKAK